MDSLSPELISSLMTRKRIASKSARFAMVRGENGVERVPLTKLDVGQFGGKQGTVKRNRKGGTSIKPNGSRKFHPNWEVEVISYQP